MTTRTAEKKATPKRRQLPIPAGLRDQLSEARRAVLEQHFAEPPDYMDSPVLTERGAAKKLFGVPAELLPGKSMRFAEPVQVAVPTGTARMPTLTADQERRLFLRLNLARLRICQIIESNTARRMSAKTARILIAWTAWEQETRERIVQLNLPLVLAMAKRTRLRGVDFNEMISEGNMALLRSVNKFDCERGFKFSTYCCRAILKAFSRVAMRTGRYRSTFPVEFDPSIERSDYLETRRDQVEADFIDDLKVVLARNMAELTQVEQTVIRQRFALGVAGESAAPKTLEQVGKVIGVTKERVRQIQNKALGKIRGAMEDLYQAA